MSFNIPIISALPLSRHKGRRRLFCELCLDIGNDKRFVVNGGGQISGIQRGKEKKVPDFNTRKRDCFSNF